MKTVLRICILLCLLCASSLSPYCPDSIKTICILTGDDDVAAFRTIGKILNSAGYDLEDSEEALMVISTEVKNMDFGTFNLDKLAIKLKAEINMADSITIIRFSGQYWIKDNLNSKVSEFYFNKYSNPITHTGIPNSAGETAWNYMMEIAKKYKNGMIIIPKL